MVDEHTESTTYTDLVRSACWLGLELLDKVRTDIEQLAGRFREHHKS